MSPEASVDRLIVCRRRPLSDADVRSAYQQEEQRDPKADGHHHNDQRGQEVSWWRARANQQRPGGSEGEVRYRRTKRMGEEVRHLTEKESDN